VSAETKKLGRGKSPRRKTKYPSHSGTVLEGGISFVKRGGRAEMGRVGNEKTDKINGCQ